MRKSTVKTLITAYLLSGIDQRELNNPKFKETQLSSQWLDEGHMEMAIKLKSLSTPIYDAWEAAVKDKEYPLSALLYTTCEGVLAGYIVENQPNDADFNNKVLEAISAYQF